MGVVVVLGRQMATLSLKMSFLEVGRERDVRRAELAPHRDVLQPCDGLAWLELGYLEWALGWMLYPSALSFSQLVFLSPSYTVICHGASRIFPPALCLPPANPLEQAGEVPLGTNPCLGMGGL